MTRKIVFILSLMAFLAFVADDSFARLGGGRSSGFRSYRPQPAPRQAPRPDEGVSRAPQQTPQQPLQRPSFFNSGIFRMLVGGLFIGGILSLLAGHGFQFGAPGLLEILIIGGLILFITRKVALSRQAGQYQYATGAQPVSDPPLLPGATEAPPGDQAINTEFIKDIARKTYTMLQEGWSRGDLAPVKNLMTVRMFDYLQEQLQDLRERGLRNVVEVVYFDRADIVETDNEDDGKVVVVQIDALLRDYTVDGSGRVIEGSKDSPVDAREYWAFVGRALDWKLDDVRQV
jgi:predicted lipid-binding transport protein (Tim44 family)